MREKGFSGSTTRSDTNRPCGHRNRLEAQNFGFMKKRDCTIRAAKTKGLISCAVTAQLICAFVFALAKKHFSHILMLFYHTIT